MLPGAVTNLLIDVSKDGVLDNACWFCCQVGWFEKESWLAPVARWIDGLMYYVAAIFDFNWHPPWRGRHSEHGEVFAGNVSAAAFFSQVYGFTTAQWSEEQRLLKQQEEDRARHRSDLVTGVRISTRSVTVGSRGDALTADELATMEAKQAFEAFCRSTRNGTSRTESENPPATHPRTPPAGSAGSGGTRHP